MSLHWGDFGSKQRIVFACVQLALQHCRSFSKQGTNTDNIYKQLNQGIERYRKGLRELVPLSSVSRKAEKALANIQRSVASTNDRIRTYDLIGENMATKIVLEVLSNGSYHVGPCAAIRTPFNTYLFNCPEASPRYFNYLGWKSNVICDVFCTRASWENFGGINSLLLSKENNCAATRIHGVKNVRSFVEGIRSFADADSGSSYRTSIDERSLSAAKYTDSAVEIHYIPLTTVRPDAKEIGDLVQEIEISFLVNFVRPSRRIDMEKVLKLGVPRGILVGRLKAGDNVILGDKRTITPEDVLFPDSNEETGSILFVECSNKDRIHLLENNSLLQDYMGPNRLKLMKYVVHFTKKPVLCSEEYSCWMDMFGSDTDHIILNGMGSCVPYNQSSFIANSIRTHIDADLFPKLAISDFEGRVNQNYEADETSNRIYARNLHRFLLRGKYGLCDTISFETSKAQVIKHIESCEGLVDAVDCYKSSVCSQSDDSNIFPCLTFLGTSSAVPTNTRNVTANLLQLSEESYILVDCGEGTYGQLGVLYGAEKCGEILTKLKAIFITHAHQDHVLGMFTIILRRYEEFSKRGMAYVPLVVTCNPNVSKPIQSFSRLFSNVLRLIVVVTSSIYALPQIPTRWNSPTIKSNQHVPLSITQDITKEMPRPIFDEEKWSLKTITAVKVYHTRMSCGYIFIDINDRKIVFSGDTKPCDNLVKYGQGADLLIHEATFHDAAEIHANFKKHSTMQQACDIAENMNAKNTILTHFSARYKTVPMLPDYLLESGKIGIAMDFMTVTFGNLCRLPKLLPVYSVLYKEELFELQLMNERKATAEVLEQQAIGAADAGKNFQNREQYSKRKKFHRSNNSGSLFASSES